MHPTLDAKRKLILWGGILAAVMLAYVPTYRAGFIWDDDAYVTENETLRSWAGLRQIWFKVGATDQFYPVVFSSFWLEYHAWGLDPLGYHCTNLLLHATAAFLGGLVLSWLGLRSAWWIAIAFALHPVNVESVAWITERKNVLSACFYLASVLAFLKYWHGSDPTKDGRTIPWWILSLALYALALMSKSITASLPAALLLLRWWQLGRITLRDILSVVPFFAVGLIMSAITVAVETALVGASGDEFTWTMFERLQIAGRAIPHYLLKLIWPDLLIFFYPKWNVGGNDWRAWIWPALTCLCIAATFVSAWHYRNASNAWEVRGIVCGIWFFLGTLFPALGFFNVFPFRYSFVADHFQYLASWGVLAVLIEVAFRVACSDESRFRLATSSLLWTGRVAMTGILLVFAVLTWKQCHVYRDRETLWKDTVNKNPQSDAAWGHLAAIANEKGDVKKAEAYLRTALAIDAKPETLMNLARMIHRKSTLKAENPQTNLQEAEGLLRRLLGRYPTYGEGWFLLADCRLRSGKPLEAVRCLKNATTAEPNDLKYRICLAELLLKERQHAAAVRELEIVCGSEPTNLSALQMLAQSYLAVGKVNASKQVLESAIHQSPTDPNLHYWLGSVQTALGESSAARRSFQTASQYAPGWPAPKEALDELSRGNSVTNVATFPPNGS